jgi:4-carboxymuconolactone decarboxylase
MSQKSGIEFLKSIDPESAEIMAEMRTRFPDLVDAFIGRLYGDAYQREGLTFRERILVTIAGVIASSSMESQLIGQARIALKNKITQEELMEIVQQVAVFSGFAKAINAALIIDSVVENSGVES